MAAGLPVFTGPIYGWKGSQNGVLLGVLGIASLPVSFIVGYISPHVSDRSLTLAAVIVTALGAVLCTQAGLRRLAVAYFGGGGMLYLVGPLHYLPCTISLAGRIRALAVCHCLLTLIMLHAPNEYSGYFKNSYPALCSGGCCRVFRVCIESFGSKNRVLRVSVAAHRGHSYWKARLCVCSASAFRPH